MFGLTLPSIIAVYLGLAYYQVTYYIVEAMMMAGFVWGVGLILSVTTILSRRKFHTFKSFGKISSVIGNVFLGLIYSFSVFGASTLAEADLFVLFVLFILYVVGLIVNSAMHQRTELGSQLYNDILGLKLFIETQARNENE